MGQECSLSVPDQQLIINTSCPDKESDVTWTSMMELLVFCFFFFPIKRRRFYKLFEKIAPTKLHIAARAKGSFPHNFRACVIYAITENIHSVSEIFNKGRVVIAAFYSLNIVSELK